MELSCNRVMELSKTAHIAMTREEAERFAGDLTKLTELVAVLCEVPEVPNTAPQNVSESVDLRADTAELTPTDSVACAAETLDGFFAVPSVLGGVK